MIKLNKRHKGANVAVRCKKYSSCQIGGKACPSCPTALTTCKHCKTRCCIDSCPDFELKMCPVTQGWPFVCPEGCPKRNGCGYPKCSYDAQDAHERARKRSSESRSGIAISEDELGAMDALVAPLALQGQSFEAIWATHAGELPVCVRSAYNYLDRGALSIAAIDLPRKVRCRPRRRKCAGSARERVDRTGRAYDDFCALPLADRARVVEGDSVVGYQENAHDILSLHFAAVAFQLYLLKDHGAAAEVVRILDDIEKILGSPEAFEAVFGIMLLDRGSEFDDFAGMERSCLGEGVSRCRVFYCDPMASNQKSQAERNHEQLRRILPKARSDFDALSKRDVAICCSHVNSYPSAGRGGKCPLELAAGIVPSELLDAFGVEQLACDDVVLRPYLMAHAVEQ